MAPTAKSVILELLSAAGSTGPALPVRSLVSGCDLLGISENSVRVTLARLAASGLIEAEERGAYRLAERATELAEQVASWRTAESRVRRWTGGYIAAHCCGLGRTDKRALRKRDRALAMLGFVELERGLHVRPDNLQDSVPEVRQRLRALGLPSQAAIFGANHFDADLVEQIARLYDVAALAASYEDGRERLERWLSRCDRLPLDAAARESFLLGREAIRQVIYDPLLPAPLVDVDKRRAFHTAAQRMDLAGRRIWQRALGLRLLPETHLALVDAGAS